MIRNISTQLLAQTARASTRSVAPRAVAAPAHTLRTFSASAYTLKDGKTKLKPGQVDEHSRIFDPDAREGTAAAAASDGDSHIGTHRPVDLSTGSDSGSAPAPSVDAGSGVDPGYAPSAASDPFPLPFSDSVNLASPSQSDSLTDYGAPLRVPGREDGDESREQRVRRLIYQTRKRGILETDLLLSTFAAKELWGMEDAEVSEFDRLLDEPDWDIYYWCVGRKEIPERWRETFETEGRLGWRLKKHTKNEEKEVRWMPDTPPEEAAAKGSA